MGAIPSFQRSLDLTYLILSPHIIHQVGAPDPRITNHHTSIRQVQFRNLSLDFLVLETDLLYHYHFSIINWTMQVVSDADIAL